MYIDCHVHCRDDEWKHKETIAHALKVAEDSGLSAIFDMPNTKPVVTTRQRVLERMALADSFESPIFYGVYIGLTSNQAQIREAVETWREFFPKGIKKTGVIGLKMFAGKSVGDLSVPEQEAQLDVYKELVKQNYSGVLVVHCEKESEMQESLWNPNNPKSWSDVRPEISEVKSIQDQLNFSLETGYALKNTQEKGKLHIAHVSVPESVGIIDSYRKMMHLSCGATPHHLLLNNQVMESKTNGFMYKVNPPLRSSLSQKLLLEQFRIGLIDILESDHAPHTKQEKEDYLSGIPNLSSWPIFIQLLRAAGVNQKLIERAAFENVNIIFGTQIQKISFPIKSHAGEYVFDPYESLR